MAEKEKTFVPPKRTRAVAVGVLRLKVDEPVYIRIDEKIHLGRNIKIEEGKEGDMKPAEVGIVTNIADNEQHTFVYGTVLKSQLDEMYPKDGYVGRCFEIVKRNKREGKRYNDYSVYEVETPPGLPPMPVLPGTDMEKTPEASKADAGKKK